MAPSSTSLLRASQRLLSRGNKPTRPHPPTGGPPGACPTGTHPALPRPAALPAFSIPPAAQAHAPALCPTPDTRARRETQPGLDPVGYEPRTCNPAPIETLTEYAEASVGLTMSAFTPGRASDHTGESGDMVCRRRSPTPSLDRRMPGGISRRRAGRDAADAHRRGDRHGHTRVQRREVAPASTAPRAPNPGTAHSVRYRYHSSGVREQTGGGARGVTACTLTGGGPRAATAPRTLPGLRAEGVGAAAYLWGELVHRSCMAVSAAPTYSAVSQPMCVAEAVTRTMLLHPEKFQSVRSISVTSRVVAIRTCTSLYTTGRTIGCP